MSPFVSQMVVLNRTSSAKNNVSNSCAALPYKDLTDEIILETIQRF